MSEYDFYELAAWREQRAERLQAPDSWLAVAGLDWLEEGANPIGSAHESAVKLPEGSAPERAAVLHLDGERLMLEPVSSSGITYNGESVRGPLEIEILPEKGSSAAIRFGRLTLYVLQRETLFGVRIYDPEHPARLKFTGLDWFPPDPAWCVRARFVAEPGALPIVNVLGQAEEALCPGYVEFTVEEQILRLYPLADSAEESFWFIFRDQTAGVNTYPSGRYLIAAPPEDGRIVLDFNRAYNPPCAYTPFATCPLPPAQNRLPLAITAGEKHFPGKVAP